MQLKQKTLFQCFAKTPSKTKEKCKEQSTEPAVAENPSDNNSCPVKTDPTDALRPIHIRQLNDQTSSSNGNPSFPTRRNIPHPHSSVSLSIEKEFFRICPQIDATEGGCPSIRLKCRSIDSYEQQMSLFAEYTMMQPFIDWRSMFDHFQENRRKALEQNQYEQLLWTDLYRPRSTAAYLGNHTRQVQRLHQWFVHWTDKLQNEQSRKTESKKRKRPLDDDGDDASEYSRETFQEDSNLSFASSFQQKSEHPQLIFVHGSGTTSLVHALAEQFNFKVTESNGSQSRARTPLLKQLEQVTSHHQLAFKRCPSDTIVSQDQSPLPARKRVKNERSSIKSYFKDEGKENRCEDASPSPPIAPTTRRTSAKKRRSKVKLEEASTAAVLDNNIFSSVHVEKTSLILFDEIETLTTDENFWSSLKKLLVTARKPIILTSNSRTNPEEAIMNLSKLGHYELIHLEAHDLDAIETFVRLILLSEMIEVPSDDQHIRQLIESSSGDIRQILNTLQYLIQSSSNESDEDQVNEVHSNPPDHQLQMSSMFDAMFYSRLNEQCPSSSLKSFFDPLTKSYLDRYDQSNEYFRGKCPNPHELSDTFKLFMQEQHISYIKDQPSFYLDYRPFVRQICQNEQKRAEDSNPPKRLRHALAFRGCSLQWSDFQILSTGLNPHH